MSTLLQLNYSLFQAINGHAGHSPWLDALMVFCANTLIFLWPLVLLLLWGRPLPWRKRPLQPGERAIVEELRAVVLWVGVACLLAFALNLALEHMVFEPRPFITRHVHLLVTHPADDSFPSDHAAWSFAVVGMLVFALPSVIVMTWRKRAGGKPGPGVAPLVLPLLVLPVALGMACSIGLARVFVGIHYPGDILGGALDGLAAAGVVTLLRQWLRRPTHAVLGFAHRLSLA